MKYIRGCEIKQIEIANDFYEAYKRCLMANNKNQIVVIPAFVNGFFACELYLKSILKANDITSSGHDIEKLFNQLPTELQKTIENEFLNEAKSIYVFNSIEFNELLKKISFGFEFWRYLYEDENKEFEDKYPFSYSKNFLDFFLPIIERLANNDN